jgi:hypothetical protein
MPNLSERTHYHIQWIPNLAIDWEPFETERVAEENAERLARRGENYKIIELDSNCERCIAARNLGVFPIKLTSASH